LGIEYVRIARFHEWTSFPKDAERELLIINLADNLCSQMGYGFFEGEWDVASLESLKALEIDQVRLEDIKEKVRTLMGEAVAVF
jgi:hypothetical protein